jgi:NodT family efflux transporter outer membrane factor (OMF) lipoprotein
VLTGRTPAEAATAEFKLADFKLPLELPVSLPSSLVRQRADIRAQEALMHRASAQVGVATADMLPRVTLGVGYGSAASKPSDLFGPGSAVWSLAAGITQPIFQGGMLRAKRDAAVAAYDQAAAQYRQTVLTAFQNVADSLTALDNDAQALKAQHEAMTAAQASLDFADKQYAAGAVAYVNVLTQQQQFQQARIDYLRALASRYQDTVTLFQALGGGWWERSRDAQASNAMSASDDSSSAAHPK